MVKIYIDDKDSDDKKTKMKMRPRQQKNALVGTQPDAGRK